MNGGIHMSTTKVRIHNELEIFLKSRKNFYQLLQLLFSDPLHGETLMQIKQNHTIQELLQEIHEGGKILHRYFEHLSECQINQERDEYNRLFVGPGPLVAPAWESYYRSKEQLLFDNCNYEVRKQYHQFGLQNVRENNEPDDHLLLELEFMIYLAELSIKKIESIELVDLLSSQISILENHLSVWIPYFCKRIIENTHSQLYLGTAILLEDFIGFDLQSLNEEKEALINV
jgi:putative dimethyl sulfoxide reductase chaperone